MSGFVSLDMSPAFHPPYQLRQYIIRLRPEQQETALHQVQIDNDLVVVLVPLGSPHLLSHQYLGSGHYSTPSSR